MRQFMGALALAAFVGAGTASPPAKAEVMVSAVDPGLCFDVNQSTNKVILYRCHGGANQDFFTPAYGQQRFNGKCLDQSGDAAGAELVVANCNSSRRQQRWALSAAGELKNESGYCVDIPNGNVRESQQVTVWTCNGGSNQKFARGRKAPPSLMGSISPSQLAAARTVGANGARWISNNSGNVIATGGLNLQVTGGRVIATGGLN